MTIEEYQATFNCPLSPEVMWAGKYLEDRGLEFGIQFGTSDAVKKAQDLILMVIEESESYGHAI